MFLNIIKWDKSIGTFDMLLFRYMHVNQEYILIFRNYSPPIKTQKKLDRFLVVKNQNCAA
jgi:hypothetical protein